MTGHLIMLRHGESLYNEKNLFTGWTDIDLSDQGIREAKNAGRVLFANSLFPDICFTSWLKRAVHTAQLALAEMEWEHIDTIRSWKLNERHYGSWQQHNKDMISQEVGEEAFVAVRRGYDKAPPPLPDGDPRLPEFDPKYRQIDPALLPRHESLKDTRERTLYYFFENIVPQLAKGRTLLVSAHGNSLRALVMAIENIDKKDIAGLAIPTGVPIVYNFDETMRVVQKNILK